MATTIAIASEKGGVGKTTVALNLALALAEKGRRTLLVDLDPQGGVGHSLARDDAELPGLADALMGHFAAADAILPTKLDRLSLLPRGRLDPADACEYEVALHTPGVFSAVLDQVSHGFELVLLDTPSGVGLVTRAALAAADFVLVPFQSEPLCLRSLSRILRVVDRVRGGENARLQLLGVLPNMVERKKDTSHSVMMEVWTGFDGVLDTVIPRADVFATASSKGLPVGYLGGRRSPEARRFEVLATEVESVIEQLSPRKHDDVERQERALI